MRFVSLIISIALISIFWPYLIPANTKELNLVFTEKEYSHEQAKDFCNTKKLVLPSLYSLIEIAHADLLTHKKTDYWSRTSIGSYAFGWSTRKKMLSFDHIGDLDHVLCIEEEKN